MQPIRNARTLVVLLLLGAAAQAEQPALGTLPPGALSTSDTDGVAAEICRDHLFDPVWAPTTLPTGYRLRTAEEAAATDPSIAALLNINPAAGNYAVGSLCFLSFSRFIVDGKPAHKTNNMTAAFWWAAAEGPLHADMRGKAQWVQLGSWYGKGTGRARWARRADPMAQFTRIDVLQTGADAWHLRLALSGEVVEADIRTTSAPKSRKSNGPGYMSVPMSGANAGLFAVYTYAGHRSRDAEGPWRATGSGVFSQALAIPRESEFLGTVFQEGWTSRAGIYRFSPTASERRD